MKAKTLILAALLLPRPEARQTLGESPSAMLLPKGEFETGLRLWRVNDDLDVLKLKGTLPAGTPDAAGNMKGHGLSLKAGFHEQITVMIDRDRRQYDYGRDQLLVHSETVAIRGALFPNREKEPYYAVQLSHRTHTGSNLSRLFTTVNINNASFTFNPAVSLGFSGMKDRETGLMLIATKQLKPKLTGSLFYEYSFADIISGINTTIPSLQIAQTLSPLSYKQHKDRFGYSLSWDFSEKDSIEMDYNYLMLSRSKDVSDPVRVNTIVNATYQHELRPNQFLNLHGRYMQNQFIGEHNFLYNTLVASRSARRYGYVGLGYTLKFNLRN